MWGDPKDYKTVGSALAEARNSAGLSQSELSARLKKPQSFVSNYEAGQRRLDLVELIKIADGLGAQPAMLIEAVLRRLLPLTRKGRKK